MKFLVDMPLSPDLASWLTKLGHDAVHAANRGLHRALDEEIMELARSESRIIVTADLDYPRLLAMEHLLSPGLILFRGGDFSGPEAESRLAHALASIPGEEFPHSIVVLERGRIRRRRLPITPQ